MSHPTLVTDLRVDDVALDLMHIVDGSDVDDDGIAATAAPHPAFDPAAAAPGEAAWVVTFTDVAGRRRVAELTLRATWREDSCGHLEVVAGAHGAECQDCGADLEPAQHRCLSCGVPVTDPATNFGVHAASCTGEYPPPCQCEHISHEEPRTAHPYLGVPAGSSRAQHVGLVCDACAGTHLAGYLVTPGGAR